MTKGECNDLAPLRSGWVDGRLSPTDTDRLTGHLAVCPTCRREIDELSRVRDLLNDTPLGTSAPPAALAERLVRIAGIEAREPLWSRPFRRTRSGVLPSRRRIRRRRLGVSAVATVTVVTAVSVVGYASAPASALAQLPDPTMATRSEFSATLAELPLGNDALATMIMARSGALRSSTPLTSDLVAAGRPSLEEAAALAELTRAASADGQLSYRGEQQVEVAVPGGSLAAEVDIVSTPDHGSDVDVRTTAGTTLVRARVPAPTSSRGGSSSTLDLVAAGFALTGSTDASLLNRRAAVIDARSPSGQLAARWWVDTSTGLLLRQEVYADGELQLAAGFTELKLDAGSTGEHGPAQLAVSQTTASMLLSSAAPLVTLGWSCQDTLNGLSLVRLRSDSATSPTMLHMVYSDGLRTVSVFERKGELTGAPSGSSWSPELKAYVSPGFPATASWQSGGAVFTVMTDASPDLVTAAVHSLPHEPLPRATTMARIVAGWSRIFHLSSG
ncbi:MAG: zf-HC2 domain-containing protein [Propionibacteriaceae bacterium]